MKILLLTFVFFGTVFAKHEEYIGWKSYYVSPSTSEQLKAVADLRIKYDLDFLGYPAIGRDGLVLIKPDLQDVFTKALDEAGVSYKVHSADIKKALEVEDELIEKRTRESLTRNGGKSFPYDNYQRLAVIDAYLAEIAEKYPKVATLVTAAHSFEGRPIKYLKISTSSFQDFSKPVIVIDAGLHAREWITPPAVTWAIHKLVEDVTEPDMLDKFDWILLPVANPDGYEYSFTNERFWRKTRSTDQSVLSGICPGVDGNRNFDFFWNTVGTSNSACSDIFAGGSAFSEIETRVVRDILREHLPRIAMYLTIHSYGSMIVYGWGHDGSLSSNALNLHLVGVTMAQAIDASNNLPNFPPYIVGNGYHILNYGASGAGEDYALSLGIPYAYTYELPGFGWGVNGFHLDPQYIEQVVVETWAGIVAGARLVSGLYQGLLNVP